MAKRFLVSLVLVLCVFLPMFASGEQEQVDDSTWLKGKTITIVIPYKAGGSVDLMIRRIGAIWSETAECTFVFENRTGGNGQIATTHVLNQKADGTTLLAYTETYQSTMYATQNPGFGVDAFSLINMQVVDPSTLTVLTSSKYMTIDDLIADIKARPGKVVCADIAGGSGTIMAKMIRDYLGLDFKIVTYADGASMRTALLGGHADFMTGTTTGDLGLGDLARPLLVAGEERSSLWPDAKTTTEMFPSLGIPASLGSARIISAPAEFKKNYPERFNYLVETYKAALMSDTYQSHIKSTGEDAVTHWYGPDKSDQLNADLYKIVSQNLKYLEVE